MLPRYGKRRMEYEVYSTFPNLYKGNFNCQHVETGYVCPVCYSKKGLNTIHDEKGWRSLNPFKKREDMLKNDISNITILDFMRKKNQ